MEQHGLLSSVKIRTGTATAARQLLVARVSRSASSSIKAPILGPGALCSSQLGCEYVVQDELDVQAGCTDTYQCIYTVCRQLSR